MKKTLRIGEGRKALQVRTWAEVHVELVEPLALAETPVPDVQASPIPGGIERRRVEVEKLEEVGRSPASSLI